MPQFSNNVVCTFQATVFLPLDIGIYPCAVREGCFADVAQSADGPASIANEEYREVNKHIRTGCGWRPPLTIEPVCDPWMFGTSCHRNVDHLAIIALPKDFAVRSLSCFGRDVRQSGRLLFLKSFFF